MSSFGQVMLVLVFVVGMLGQRANKGSVRQDEMVLVFQQ
jgi:hypothetical protein